MSDLRTAAQQALEALETLVPTKGPSIYNSARDALRAALAQQDEPVAYTTGHCENHKQKGGCQLHNLQCGWPDCDRKPTTAPPQQAEPVEPVAGVVLNEEGRAALVEHGREEWHCVSRNARRLYTAPPQRKPLTEEEIDGLVIQHAGYGRDNFYAVARAVERAHGIKE